MGLRRAAKALTGVLLVAVVVACTSGGDDTAPDNDAAEQRRADGALLSVGDLPDHWSDSAAGAGVALKSADCAFDAVDAGPMVQAEADGFEHVSGDSLHHAVMIFASDQQAERFLREFVASADCIEERTQRAVDGGEVIVHELAVPQHGDRAVGLRYEGSANGRSAFSDMVAIRIADAVTLVTLARLYSPPELSSTDLLRTAVAKLSP